MNVYLYQNNTEKILKNAYIGEVKEYSIDFRWNTQAWIEANGWTFTPRSNPSYSFSSSWLTVSNNGWQLLIARSIDTTQFSKITLTWTGYLFDAWWQWDWKIWLKIWQVTTDFNNESLNQVLCAVNWTEASWYRWFWLWYNGAWSWYWTIQQQWNYTRTLEIDLSNWAIKWNSSDWQALSWTLNSTWLWYVKSNSTQFWIFIDSRWHTLHTFNAIFE